MSFLCAVQKLLNTDCCWPLNGQIHLAGSEVAVVGVRFHELTPINVSVINIKRRIRIFFFDQQH